MSVVRQNDRGFGVGDCSGFLQGLLGGALDDCWIQFYERISNLKGFVYLDLDRHVLNKLGSVALFDGRSDLRGSGMVIASCDACSVRG